MMNEEYISTMKPILISILGVIIGYVNLDSFFIDFNLVEFIHIVKDILASTSFVVSIFLGLRTLLKKKKKKK